MDSQQLTALLLPTALGAAGSGALAAHLSHKTRRRNEDPAQHRRRVLRNALAGAALGGGTGALIPGALMVGEGYAGAKPGVLSGAADQGLGLLTGNLAGLATAGAGAYGVARNHRNVAERARAALADQLYNSLGGAGSAGAETRRNQLLADSASGEALEKALLNRVAQEGDINATAAKAFELNDLVRASGGSGANLRNVLRQAMAVRSSAPVQDLDVDRLMGQTLQRHLGKEGPVSNWLGRQIGELRQVPDLSPADDTAHEMVQLMDARLPERRQLIQRVLGGLEGHAELKGRTDILAALAKLKDPSQLPDENLVSSTMRLADSPVIEETFRQLPEGTERQYGQEFADRIRDLRSRLSMTRPQMELAGRFNGPEALTRRLPSPLRLAEKYQEHINPAAWRTLRRIPTLAAVLGIVPVALLANRLQKQVTGQ